MSLSSLDLNLLLVLDTVLAERSVVRAARRLHVTPPAISNALARLRAVLGDPLIVRSGRGIVPTPRASALAPALGKALRELDVALHGDAFDPATSERELTLAIADAGQMVKLPKLVAALNARMPRARLRVSSIDRLFAVGGLAGTEIDVLIGTGESAPGVSLLPLYEETLVLVARAHHPWVGRRVSKVQLGALRHVEVEVAPGRSSRALAASYAASGVGRDIALVVPTFAAAAAVVAESDLVASLPQSLVDVLGPRLALVPVATPLAPVRATINLVWHERTHADPACRLLRELIVDTLGHRRAVRDQPTSGRARRRS